MVLAKIVFWVFEERSHKWHVPRSPATTFPISAAFQTDAIFETADRRHQRGLKADQAGCAANGRRVCRSLVGCGSERCTSPMAWDVIQVASSDASCIPRPTNRAHTD